MKNTKEKESWLTDARKVMITQLLTLLVTPLSVAMTIYLTEYYKAPQPDIQFTTSERLYYLNHPSDSIRVRLNSNSILAANIRQELEMTNANSSIAWLNGQGDWDSECEAVFQNLNIKIQGMLKDMLNSKKMRQSSGPLNKIMPITNDEIKESEDAIKIVDNFSNELKSNAAKENPISGMVQFTVGILNKGASDGVIYNEAILSFGDKKIKIYADAYTPIKSHSFEEVIYKSAGENEGQFDGWRGSGEDKIVKELSDLVKNGIEIPFTITVTLSDKKEFAKGTIGKI